MARVMIILIDSLHWYSLSFFTKRNHCNGQIQLVYDSYLINYTFSTKTNSDKLLSNKQTKKSVMYQSERLFHQVKEKKAKKKIFIEFIFNSVSFPFSILIDFFFLCVLKIFSVYQVWLRRQRNYIWYCFFLFHEFVCV